jgi:hypothetical protein
MTKQPHIPETKEGPSPNREQRRHPEKIEDAPIARERPQPDDQDVGSVRAKSSGHKKKTADKWNQ